MSILQLIIQIPQNVPHPDDSEPLVLQTPFDYIFYLALPFLFLIGGYFFLKVFFAQGNKISISSQKVLQGAVV